nr:IS5 family transposase [Rubritepida flocculans]
MLTLPSADALRIGEGVGGAALAQRRIGQSSLAEALLPTGAGVNRRLERIAGLIDPSWFERLLAPLRAPGGRPGYPPLALFKASLLAQWYRLSGPGLEEALAGGLSFRRFRGFGLDDGTPDETTLCRFRAALAERELPEALFGELNRQLDARGLVLKAGTPIDAALVEVAVARPALSEGEVSTRDPDAGFTRRGQKSFFGFEAHLAVDLGTDLVRGAILTGADVGDSLAADASIQGDEAAVFADKAYDSTARREALAKVGVADGIMHRAHPRRRSVSWQRWMNVAPPDPRPSRARLRHPQAQLRLAPRPLPRSRPQRRPPALALHRAQPAPRRPARPPTGAVCPELTAEASRAAPTQGEPALRHASRAGRSHRSALRRSLLRATASPHSILRPEARITGVQRAYSLRI